MVQYSLPFFPTFGSALPLKSDRSACTIHNVENTSVNARRFSSKKAKVKNEKVDKPDCLSIHVGISLPPLKHHISTSNTESRERLVSSVEYFLENTVDSFTCTFCPIGLLECRIIARTGVAHSSQDAIKCIR